MKGYPDNMLENRQLYKKYLQSAKKKFYIVYKNNCKNTESKNCNRALDIFHFSVLHVLQIVNVMFNGVIQINLIT